MKNKRRRNRKATEVVFNFVADADSGFISLTVTRRKMATGETTRADWCKSLHRGGFHIRMIGRGDELTDVFLNQLATAYAGGLSVWRKKPALLPDMGFIPLFSGVTMQDLVASSKRQRKTKTTR